MRSIAVLETLKLLGLLGFFRLYIKSSLVETLIIVFIMFLYNEKLFNDWSRNKKLVHTWSSNSINFYPTK